MTNMDKYLGVKLVHAEPQLKGHYLGAIAPNQAVSEFTFNEQGYKVIYEDGYTSWSPKDVFEKAYKQFDTTKFGIIVDVDTRTGDWAFVGVYDGVTEKQNLSFGTAIEALKNNKKVARVGWNGKGMYLKLIQGRPVNGHLQPAIGKEYEDGRQDSSIEAMFNIIPATCPDGSPNITQGKPGQMLSHIVMKTAGDSAYWGVGFSDYVPWQASQTDMLAEDWEILE